MLNFLNQPYPFSYQPSRRIKQILPIGLFVFTFLIFFKPFGLDGDPGYIQTSAFISFSGGVIGLLTTVVIPYFFPKYFNESNWTLKRNLTWNGVIFFCFATFMFLAFNIYAIYHFDAHGNFTLENYLWWLYLNLIFGFPMGIIINLVNQYYLLKKHLKTANNINSSIKTSTEQSTIGFAANLLEFEIDRFKKVNIEPENLIYIEAFGNYINVIYADNDIKKITVRETITNIEDKMEGVIIIYKPHRSYLVNLQKVEKITGDSQGLKLHLKSIDKVIPVSRNKIKEFRERITSHD